MSDLDDNISIEDSMLSDLEAEAGKDETQTAGEPAPPDVPTEEILQPLIDMTCAVLAPEWKIEQSEVEQLSKSYAMVIDKYFPGGGFIGVEFNALLLTVAVFGKRIGTPRTVQTASAEIEISAPDQEGEENKNSELVVDPS